MTYNLEWLRTRFDQGVMLKFIFFWGHTSPREHEIDKACFSQWYPAPFIVGGINYKTSEHWMMAQKAQLFGATEIFNKILAAEKPGEVKELGRQIESFDEKIWNEKKYEIVKQGSIHKFEQNKKLGEYLLNTTDRVLVEASPVDTVWGIGLSQNSRNIENPNTWRGQNLLGFALMEARDALQSSLST